MAHDGQTLGERSNEARQGVRKLGREHGFEAQSQLAQPLGMPGHHEEERDARQRGDERRDAAELDPRQLGGVSHDDAWADREHEEREEQEHDQQVEEPLEDNRRKGSRRAQPFATRQHVRADDLSGSRRQQEARGKPNHGRSKRCAEVGFPERRQQILPSERTDGIGRQCRHERQRQRKSVRATGFSPDSLQIGVAE